MSAITQRWIVWSGPNELHVEGPSLPWMERTPVVPEADVERLRKGVIEELVNSQAELQTALGLYRMGRERRDFDPYIESRMQASLAMQHEILATLGHPMAQTAQMPEGWMPA